MVPGMLSRIIKHLVLLKPNAHRTIKLTHTHRQNAILRTQKAWQPTLLTGSAVAARSCHLAVSLGEYFTVYITMDSYCALRAHGVWAQLHMLWGRVDVSGGGGGMK